MQDIHIFTSCSNNYIPKARILGYSLKKYHPQINFHLVLSDIILDSINLEKEPFDSIITIEELNIANLSSWIFKHSLVEMCTAVKSIAFQKIMNQYNCTKVIYFDPDIVIFNPINDLINKLDNHSILLTPHQLEPEKFMGAIIHNEQVFLKYGVFNLGFLGVKNSPQGNSFLQWWSDRCFNFCYDDISNGLFTDQRLIDLAPSFFSELHILRSPIYNVANWNLTHRIISGNIDEGILVNNKPLCFYHFSNAQEIMYKKYNVFNDVVISLWDWYNKECDTMGAKDLGKKSCSYSYFDNDELITKEQRLLYRQTEDLQEQFPDPFSTKNMKNSYYYWYQEYEKNNNKKLLQEKLILENLQQEMIREKNYSKLLAKKIDDIQKELQDKTQLIKAMENSKFWQVRNQWFKIKEKIGLPTD